MAASPLDDEVLLMPVDPQEQRAIHFLAQRIRRQTYGAKPWDDHGLAANLAKLAERNLHMTVEAVLRHAADPQARNPGVILGAFVPEAPTGRDHFRPPKRTEECRKHPGQWPQSCGPCATEGRAVEWEPDPADTPPAPEPDPALPGPARVRAALRAAKGAVGGE